MKASEVRGINSGTCAIAALVVLCSATVSAQASDPMQEGVTRTVTYGDLNLDSRKDVQALYGRLRFAAQEVCSAYEARELARRRVWQTCIASALASAVAQVNNPKLTALLQSAANRPTPG